MIILKVNNADIMVRKRALTVEAIAESIKKTAITAKIAFVRATPIGTGIARRGWIINSINKLSKVIVNTAMSRGAPYPTFLEYGTGIYGPYKRPIVPVNGKYMRFPIRAGNSIKGWVTTKSVKGVKAYRMIAKNLNAVISFFKYDLTAKIKTI